MKEELEKIKDYVWDNKRRLLCSHTFWCNLDGYCPNYNCGSLDRLAKFTDRQWLNAIKKVKTIYKQISFEDLVHEVLDELRDKRPSRLGR